MITNNDISIQYDVFRKNIKYYRKKNNLTQEKLAELSNVSESYIKEIESNKEFTNVSLTIIFKISKALGVSVEKLFKITFEED